MREQVRLRSSQAAHVILKTADLRKGFRRANVFSAVAGFMLGFATVTSTVAATVFLVVGVAGHLVVRADYDCASVVSFDPSTVASRASLPAVVAVSLSVLFWLIARRLPPKPQPKVKLRD